MMRSISSKKLPTLSFLFGSGISIPAKLPSVVDITEKVLSGEDIWKNSDGNYYLNKLEQSPQLRNIQYVHRVTEFLNYLKRKSDDHLASYNPPRESNYEDLFYLTRQISDNELGEFENPAIKPFVDNLVSDAMNLRVAHNNNDDWDLVNLSNEAEKYILCVAWHFLSHEPSTLRHLSVLIDAIVQNIDHEINLFTLNHDTVLERSLSSASIQFNDGFSEQVNGIRYWQPVYFERAATKIRILKVHGSVNWFRYPPNQIAPGVESIGIPSDWDFWHTSDPNGERQWPRGGTPEILLGTFNKILSYTSGIYADIYYHFRRFLRASKSLVISGYGFRDKAINMQVTEWLYLSNENKIILIDPKANEIPLTARPVVSNNWREWLNQGKLKLIESGIQDVKWSELSSCLE